MNSKLRYALVTVIGGFLSILGAIFIVLPGPAFLFLPVGLGILSLEHEWAKGWLKHCQRWMRKSAVQADKWIAQLSRKLRNR